MSLGESGARFAQASPDPTPSAIRLKSEAFPLSNGLNMTIKEKRHVLSGVTKLQFGPESDVFSNALRIVLSHLEGKNIEYRDILCTSGRAFKLTWNTRFWNWEKSMDKPDPDAEYYLRNDYETMDDAFEAAGYAHEILFNKDCRFPVQKSYGALARGKDYNAFVNREYIKKRVVQSIHDKERPVVALLSVTGELWAPEWCIITGYDDSGDVIIGWSCFQDAPEGKGHVQCEPNGHFRLKEWEKEASTVVLVGDKKEHALSEKEVARRVLEYAVRYSQGSVKDQESMGFDSYTAWAQGIEDERITNMDYKILEGKILYHRHFIGHLAAQKWYTSDYLHNMKHKGWNVSDILYASANYAKIHELMWDCWKIFGGYWRETKVEVEKSRDGKARQEAVSIIDEAKNLDMNAVDHLESALENFSKTHGYYLKS